MYGKTTEFKCYSNKLRSLRFKKVVLEIETFENLAFPLHYTHGSNFKVIICQEPLFWLMHFELTTLKLFIIDYC